MSPAHRRPPVTLWLLLFVFGCGAPAALDSPEARKSADALYTAITSRQPELVDATAVRLQELSRSGKLSAAALEELGVIIEQSRANQWQEAAEAMDAFLREQPPEHH